jgi:hypothetical protein
MPNENLILFRYVTKGRKGTITYAVEIHIDRLPPVSPWKIESATKAYKGLQGEGNESENANWEVTILRGKVWR